MKSEALPVNGLFLTINIIYFSWFDAVIAFFAFFAFFFLRLWHHFSGDSKEKSEPEEKTFYKIHEWPEES